jgi:hypothetical protein
MEVSGGGGFLLLLFVVVLMPRSATVLLADAARRTLTDVSSPPAPSPAADAPILPGVVVSPPTGEHPIFIWYYFVERRRNVIAPFVTVHRKSGCFLHRLSRIYMP